VAKSVCRAMKRKVRSGRNPASLVPSILSPRLSSGDLYSLPPLTNLSVGASVARSFAGVRARTRRLFTDSTFEEFQELRVQCLSLSLSPPHLGQAEWVPTVALARGLYGPVE